MTDNNRSADPDWFKDLNRVDRNMARQMLAMSSQAQMLRISKAVLPKKGVGRTKAVVPEEWKRLALETFLSTAGIKIGDAAGIAAKILHERGTDGTQANTRRKISDALKPLNLDNPRVGDMLKLAPIANEMQRSGRPVRPDLFSGRAVKMLQDVLSRFQRDSASGGTGRMNSIFPSRNHHATCNMQHVLERQIEKAAYLRRDIAFFEAFEHLIPDDIPFSQLRHLYDRVQDFVRYEMPAQQVSAEIP